MASGSSSRAITHFHFHNHIETLSEELLLEILSYLSVADLSIVSRLSLRFNRLADEPQLWRRIYSARFAPAKLRHPFVPALDQRLRGGLESGALRIESDRKGKRKQLNPDDQGAHGYSWKTLCRVSQNWQTGSAQLTRIDPTTSPLTPPAPSRAQSGYARPDTVVRFCGSLVFVACRARSPCQMPAVQVHHLQSTAGPLAHSSVLLGTLLPVSLPDASLAGLGVTEISIDDAPAPERAMLVAVFYTSGHFTIFRIEKDFSGPTPTLEARELASHKPTSELRHAATKLAHASAETARLQFPLVVTCSTDFCLRFYRLSKLTSTSGELQITKLPLDMHNAGCYWPLSLSLCRRVPSQERFTMTIAYPMPFYPSTWTVGLQEFEFELPSGRSPGMQMHQNRFVTAFAPPQDKSRRPLGGPGVGAFVVGIEQAAGNVVVGRADNTIDCFRLAVGPECAARRLVCSKTLFGHTARIGSISVDDDGRCVSGAVDGVKVWEGAEAVDVREDENVKRAECRRVGWIGSDAEKIVSLWVWETEDQDGKTMVVKEEVRVMSFI